jgi:cobalt-zinc-cadmium efflux system protein
VKDRIKAALSDHFDIEHTTLELECARHACDDPSEFGGRGHGEERHG